MKLRVKRNIQQLRIREITQKNKEKRQKTLGDVLIETAKKVRVKD